MDTLLLFFSKIHFLGWSVSKCLLEKTADTNKHDEVDKNEK